MANWQYRCNNCKHEWIIPNKVLGTIGPLSKCSKCGHEMMSFAPTIEELETFNVNLT